MRQPSAERRPPCRFLFFVPKSGIQNRHPSADSGQAPAGAPQKPDAAIPLAVVSGLVLAGEAAGSPLAELAASSFISDLLGEATPFRNDEAFSIVISSKEILPEPVNLTTFDNCLT